MKQQEDEITTLTVTEQISVEVVYWARVREVPCSILGNKFAYPELGISSFSSVPPGKCSFQIRFQFVIHLSYHLTLLMLHTESVVK
jgi:hypothetical protein